MLIKANVKIVRNAKHMTTISPVSEGCISTYRRGKSTANVEDAAYKYLVVTLTNVEE